MSLDCTKYRTKPQFEVVYPLQNPPPSRLAGSQCGDLELDEGEDSSMPSLVSSDSDSDNESDGLHVMYLLQEMRFADHKCGKAEDYSLPPHVGSSCDSHNEADIDELSMPSLDSDY